MNAGWRRTPVTTLSAWSRAAMPRDLVAAPEAAGVVRQTGKARSLPSSLTYKSNIQHRLLAAVAGLALAGTASLCFAASPITQTFDSNIDGWVINYSTGGASVSWNSSMGWDPNELTVAGGC